MLLPDEKIVLDGATADPQALETRFYRAALICGLAPLAIGIAIFLLWTVVRWPWLQTAGVVNICAGVVSVCVGAVCLVAYAVPSVRANSDPRNGARIATAITALLINFPAVVLVLVLVGLIIERADVIVVNEGPGIDRLVLYGGGAEIDFGAIPSGETRVSKVDFQQDGSLEFHANRGGQEIHGVVEGYVTPGQGLHAELMFSPSGDWSVRDRAQPAD
jgi:hypothetical protein